MEHSTESKKDSEERRTQWNIYKTAHNVRVSALEDIIASSIRGICSFALEHEEEFLETVRTMNDKETERIIIDSRNEKQTAKAKPDYDGVIKGLDTFADITEIATRVYSAKTKMVEQEKKQEHLQQKRKKEQSL